MWFALAVALQWTDDYAELLVRRIDVWRHSSREKVCVATFNYDLLFEDAAVNQLGVDFWSMHGYTTGDQYKYVKLHGSVNWARRVPTPGGTYYSNRDQARRVLIDNADTLTTKRGDFIIIDPAESPSDAQSLHFPAIAIPTERKFDFECPPSQIAALEACIRRSIGSLQSAREEPSRTS